MRRLNTTLPIVLIALVFVICVGVLLYVMRGGQQATPPGDDEGQIARASASPVVTGGPITDIGSPSPRPSTPTIPPTTKVASIPNSSP